jgi:hypothetical protein
VPIRPKRAARAMTLQRALASDATDVASKLLEFLAWIDAGFKLVYTEAEILNTEKS